MIKTVHKDKKMKTLPTDLKIIDTIYERYYTTFASFSEDAKNRNNKIYVPIDVKIIADDLGVDPDIIFGRLYYDLDQKYRYEQPDGSTVHFFARQLNEDHNCVNFPYMASVLSKLREENKKYRIATTLAIVSLFVSAVALLISIFV
ncbi:MAG: hypothetical protein WC455_06275 [Dehalococcoidia bacterium]